MALEALVAALFPVGLLAFEEQGEAVLEGQLADVGHGGLFLEGLGHAREPGERVLLVVAGLVQAGREDGLDGLVAQRADVQRAAAGGLQAFGGAGA